MIDSLMSSAYFIKAVVVWWVLILLGKLIKNHQFWRYIAILRIWKIIIKSQHSVLLTVSTGIEMMLFQSVKILEDGIDDGDELSSIVSIWISLTFSSSNMHSSREITTLFEVIWLLLLFEFSFDWSSDDLVDWIKKISRNVVWSCLNSVFNIKYHKQKQSTRGTYDFEKVLCFALCSEKQNTLMVLCKIKKYFAYLLSIV